VGAAQGISEEEKQQGTDAIGRKKGRKEECREDKIRKEDKEGRTQGRTLWKYTHLYTPQIGKLPSDASIFSEK
jgi:hypothetical protein